MTFALLLVCFFLSGFSALLYETAWTREFAFVFGKCRHDMENEA